MKPSMQFSFKPVTLASAKTYVSDPVAVSVRKSNVHAVMIRISGSVVKQCAFKNGESITPFVDMPNRAILLLSGQRPEPKCARKIRAKEGSGFMTIEFPRVDEFKELFPVLPMRGVELKEAAHGRLVFVVPAN